MAVDLLVTEDTPAGEALVRVLEEAGIEFVFGVSGGHTGTFFKHLGNHTDRIRTVLVRQESLSGVMAEVYGRLTGKPGVTIGQGAWVLGYGLVGVLEAHLSATPMLILVDFSDKPGAVLHGAYQSGRGHHGGWDAALSFKGVTKQVFSVLEPAEMVHGAQLAIKHATDGQPGPVALIFGGQAMTGTVSPASEPRLYSTKYYLQKPNTAADPEAIRAAVSAIAASERPVIVAGGGVRLSGAFDMLRKYAEAEQIPVVSSQNGKGMLEETHPLALGVCGRFGAPAASFCLADADCVVVVGSKLGSTDFLGGTYKLLDPERQTIVQIDIDARNAGWTQPVQHALVGDAKDVLAQLMAASNPPDRGPATEARLKALRDRHGHFDSPKYWTDTEEIIPQRVIGEMMRSLPNDVVVTADAGENRIFLMSLYQTRQPGRFIMAGGAGPMGYAIPAALSAKLVFPDSPVVAVCGDGGFGMTMNGLLTAISENIPITVIVFNNGSLGWSRKLRGDFTTVLGDFDYAAIAAGMGCEAWRVEDPADLQSALTAAIASGRPSVIDVAISFEGQSFLEMQADL
ncbi:thiamine pyrophosphate-binding protein [Oceanicola sp. 22II-s10i]|uniref:thiamine pyrophosphate-binding protein n=1 Tax=Oceanicola sp. 22II-s10i TaxID=1317116 RepID=UPI0015955CA0|nr:thiamine pyrophosphate-binding protein [Oceanicola sp. 22II-s10i]